MISFAYPQYLGFVIIGSLLTLFFYLFTLSKVRRFLKELGAIKKLRKFGKIPNVGFDILRVCALALAVLFLGMILLGPKLEIKTLEPEKESEEIIFALDVSLSSLARDVVSPEGKQISRLDLEKNEVGNVIRSLKLGDAIGLVVFADRAIPLQTVLSREDYQNTLLRNLAEVDNDFVRFGVPQGTSFGEAMATCLAILSHEKNKKIIFFLTDGEQQGEEGELGKALDNALEEFSDFRRKHDISVYVIGVGNVNEASLIPKAEDGSGNPIEYYTYIEERAKGQKVRTQPDPLFLSQVASATGGIYIHARDGQELQGVLKEIIEKERRVIGFKEKTERTDITPHLLLFSLVLLFIIPIIKVP